MAKYYIEKDLAVALLTEDSKEYCELDERGLHSEKWCGYAECIDTINAMDAVEAVPPRYAKWVMREDGVSYTCSDCGRIVEDIENFCPSCGAKMKKEG